jgi:hypothetical protein
VDMPTIKPLGLLLRYNPPTLLLEYTTMRSAAGSQTLVLKMRKEWLLQQHGKRHELSPARRIAIKIQRKYHRHFASVPFEQLVGLTQKLIDNCTPMEDEAGKENRVLHDFTLDSPDEEEESPLKLATRKDNGQVARQQFMGNGLAWVEESACRVPISSACAGNTSKYASTPPRNRPALPPSNHSCTPPSNHSSTPLSACRGQCTGTDRSSSTKKSVRWVDESAYSGLVLRRIKFFDASVPVERCILQSTRPRLSADLG